MKTLNIEDVQIGSVIEEPIYLNGILLFKRGVPLSESLKEVLIKFGKKTLTVNSIFTEKIDNNRLTLDNLNNMTYCAIQRLSIDDILMCSKLLVKDILDRRYKEVLKIFFQSDDVTYNHSVNTAVYSVAFGIKYGLSLSDLKSLAIGSLLHDIGKSGVARDIINKPEKLTDEEIKAIKTHPENGYNMVKKSDFMNETIKQIILQHHENWDGSGYPNNLYGTNSFLLARIVHIADVYDALCAKRTYKEALPKRLVREIMLEKSKVFFDPSLLRKFLEYIPMYTVGEEISYKGKLGIICDNEDKDNPLVFYKNEIVRLSEFENITEERKEIISQQTKALKDYYYDINRFIK